MDQSQSAVNEWLNALGFTEAQANTDIDESANETSDAPSERTIRIFLEKQEILITLYDTPATNALYDMLPLELTFEDYNGIEKISYLSEKLPTESEPVAFTYRFQSGQYKFCCSCSITGNRRSCRKDRRKQQRSCNLPDAW